MKAILLADLLRQETWDKDVVLWKGPIETLRARLGAKNTVELDLLDVVPPDFDPAADNRESEDEFRRALENRLRSIEAIRTGPQVLVVRNAPLLARFGVGGRPFYDWHAGSQSMTILAVEGFATEVTFPPEAEYDACYLSHYFEQVVKALVVS